MRGNIQTTVENTMKITLAVLLLTSLAGCASTASQQEKVGAIVATPFNDLNITDTTIPPVLAAARAAPYAVPTVEDCSATWDQVLALDIVLGPDLDVPAMVGDTGKLAWAASTAEDAATGALKRTVEGAIPFRGWVRKLSGAERAAKNNAQAIAAGTARRAFLKGVAVARGCARPAAMLAP
jgi:hypothetical protein